MGLKPVVLTAMQSWLNAFFLVYVQEIYSFIMIQCTYVLLSPNYYLLS